MQNLLLIDADEIAFKAALYAETETRFSDDFHVLWCDEAVAMRNAKERITLLQDTLQADDVILCFSASKNWRYAVDPTYKSNRKGVRKPMRLSELKARLEQEYTSKRIDTLEADDVMGILATDPNYMPSHRKIVVSSDKDMKTLPAWLFNPDKSTEPEWNDEASADFWHMMQTLTGDDADGYKGCEGVGAVTAERALSSLMGVEPYEHEFKSGQRKGQSETRWRQVVMPDMWSVVVSYYNKAGFSEEDALTQARLARILRHSDYDFEKQQVILWQAR
jgi:DNA polymerase-1